MDEVSSKLRSFRAVRRRLGQTRSDMRLRILVTGLVFAALVAAASGCDASSYPSETVTTAVDLTPDQPVSVVEFEGTLVVADSTEDFVAGFARHRPDVDDLERAGVDRIRSETWLDGEWVLDAFDATVSLSPGMNLVRYRWTLTLDEGSDAASVPIRAELGPAFADPLELAPTKEQVPTVELRIASVTYP